MRTKYTPKDLLRDVREFSYEFGVIAGFIIGLGVLAWMFTVLGAEIAPL